MLGMQKQSVIRIAHWLKNASHHWAERGRGLCVEDWTVLHLLSSHPLCLVKFIWLNTKKKKATVQTMSEYISGY